MGKAYRVRDTKIGWHVAIKILPAEFATGAERMLRFEQEARAAGTGRSVRPAISWVKLEGKNDQHIH